MPLTEITRYELPPNGITLLGYIVRRMHKTQWLTHVADMVASNKTEDALAHVAMYAVTASTSFGKAYYQPRFNNEGEEIAEPDPFTKADVRARLLSSSPTYKISYSAVANGSIFTGSEEITGTTVGLRGLGMPAPSKFQFSSGNYTAELAGIITSELALSLFGNTRIRGYGFLNFSDSANNLGKLNIDRHNTVKMTLNGKDWHVTAPFQIQAKVT